MPRVVVVGAGIAGVAAVGELRKAGLCDVILLEAQDTPGGRIRTVQLDKGFVELGAQFLHGQNELYEIAHREHMLTEEEDPTEDALPDTLLQYRHFLFQTSGGDKLPSDVVGCNIQILEDLQAEANGSQDPDVCQSIGDLVRRKTTEAKTKMLGSEKLKDAMLKWLDVWERMDSGGSLDQMSVPGTHQYHFYPGDGTKETKQGMEAVFQSLLRECVPQSCLRLNKPVKAIHWSATTPTIDVVSGIMRQLNIGKDGDERSVECCKGATTDCGININNNNNDNNFADKASIAVRKANADMSEGGESLRQPVSESKGQNPARQIPNADSEINGDEIALERLPLGTNAGGETLAKDKSSSNQKSSVMFKTADPVHSPKQPTRSTEALQVKIECEDGDVIHADHVIVTSSVGFLRENSSFFQPPLPAEHQTAIATMGWGDVSKIFLLWEEKEFKGAASWPACLLGSDAEGVIPLWTDDAKPRLKSAVSGQPLEDGRQWYEHVCMYNVADSLDLCLVAWIGGEGAVAMEAVPEAEVKAVLHELLTLFLDRPDIPPPSRLIRTEWYNNRYIRGAYSYLATGVPLEMHGVMSRPVPSPQIPVVQLAGEACSRHSFSTAHGALQSGRDAARVILRHYNLMTQ